jgi:hypothetical protein
MEPADKIFDETHDFIDNDGHKVNASSFASSGGASPSLPLNRK